MKINENKAMSEKMKDFFRLTKKKIFLTFGFILVTATLLFLNRQFYIYDFGVFYNPVILIPYLFMTWPSIAVTSFIYSAIASIFPVQSNLNIFSLLGIVVHILYLYFLSCLWVFFSGKIKIVQNKMGEKQKKENVRKTTVTLKGAFMPNWLNISILVIFSVMYSISPAFCYSIHTETRGIVYSCGSGIATLLSLLSIFPLLSFALAYVLSCLIILVYRRMRL